MSSRLHRAIFIVGVLVAIPLATTVAVLLLRRTFPDNVWLNGLGPAVSALAALCFAQSLNRKR